MSESKRGDYRKNEPPVHHAIRDWPESERPREKLIRSGAGNLTDGELLAVLLRTGMKGQSAEDIGRRLLSKFNGVSGIDRAHVEELLTVPGLGIAKAAQIKAALEIGKRARMQAARPEQFTAVSAVTEYLRPRFEGKRQEIFLTLLLDTKHRLIAERIISEGTPNQAVVFIRRVMEEALRVSASAIITAHNHPSGDPTPSRADFRITTDIQRAAELLNLSFLDHIIIGGEYKYYSFRESGVLQG